MALPMMNFPLLSPEQASPFAQGFNIPVQTMANLLKNQLTSQQIPLTALKTAFYGPKAMADIYSQTAYAMGRGPEIAGKIASDPGILGALGEDGVRDLVRRLANLGISFPGIGASNISNNTYSPVQSLSSNQDLSTSYEAPGIMENQGDINAQRAMPNYAATSAAVTPESGIEQPLSPNTNRRATDYIGGKARQAKEEASQIGAKPGSTFVDPETGEIKSAPTTDIAGNLQGQIIAGRALDLTDLPKLYDQVPLGGPGLLQKGGEAIESFLTGNQGYSPGISAEQKLNSAIKQKSEGMMKAMGLTGAVGNREATEEIMAPAPFESKQTYKERIQYLDNLLKSRDKKFVSTLANQLVLNPQLAKTKDGIVQASVMAMQQNGNSESGIKTPANTRSVYNPKTGRIERK